MALTGAMSAGISGLRAHMGALNTVGNNVANVNTQGYKAGRVTFKESIYSTQSAGGAGTALMGSTNPRQTGYGTGIGSIDLDMTTKSLDPTGNDLDLAISGDGYFLVGPKNITVENVEGAKALKLSRVGAFKIDTDGYLVDRDGNVVYGFLTSSGEATAGTTAGAVSTDLVPIRLPLMSTGDDGGGVQTGAAIYPGVGADGHNVPATGENVSDSVISYEDLSIGDNGAITCTNSKTKERVTVGYIALGTVTNPAGLTHTEGPYYTAGDAAGAMSVFTPNGSVTGALRNQEVGEDTAVGDILDARTTKVMPGFLEGSGTDLAQEFSNMILYQRGYQANTRIVTVTDSMLEELVNMKR